MYLPLFQDNSAIKPDLPVFYGAINVYLKFKMPFLRKAPAWFTKIFDSSALLHVAAKKAGSTRAATLGEMTISLLRGDEGEHSDELKRLVRTLRNEVQPDIVHLSNALLLGLVRSIKLELGVQVTCSLQDEHTWIDAMVRRHADSVWSMVEEKASEVSAFFPVSRYYAQKMMNRLRIPGERLYVIHIGLDLEHYRPVSRSPNPPVIGFLSRISESQGLGLLAKAFINLKRDSSLRETKLRISGGQTGDDRKFIRRLTKLFGSKGVSKDVEFVHDFDRDSRIRFLGSLTVLSVPALSEHAYGIYLIEALALGIPVVQPGLGAFPELIRETGKGIVYSPNNVDALTSALKSLLGNRENAAALGKQGSKAVHAKFSIETMAKRMLDVYQSCLK
jgi:glycosyltransferase involved in cell wall biosynthesis